MPRDFLPGFNVAANMGFAKGVLLLEDFNSSLTWIITGTGGDDVHEVAAQAAFSGAYGLRLKTRTTSAAANDVVFATRFFSWPESGLVVLRGRFALVDSTKVSKVQVDLFLRDGSRLYEAQLLYQPNTPALSYLGSAGVPVPLASAVWSPLNDQWVQVEMIVDALSFEYVSVMANGVREVLPGVAIYDVAASSLRGADVRLSVVAIGAAPAEAYFDDLYVGEFVSA
jgi:hypothetical protein